MTNEEITKRFAYHPPRSEEEVGVYEMIRAHARAVAILLVDICPESRELSLAITHLEEAVFWANASIARNPR